MHTKSKKYILINGIFLLAFFSFIGALFIDKSPSKESAVTSITPLASSSTISTPRPVLTFKNITVNIVQVKRDSLDNFWITAEVKNLNETSIDIKKLTINFYDKDGKYLGLSTGYIKSLAKDEQKVYQFATDDDLTKLDTYKWQID